MYKIIIYFYIISIESILYLILFSEQLMIIPMILKMQHIFQASMLVASNLMPISLILHPICIVSYQHNIINLDCE